MDPPKLRPCGRDGTFALGAAGGGNAGRVWLRTVAAGEEWMAGRSVAHV